MKIDNQKNPTEENLRKLLRVIRAYIYDVIDLFLPPIISRSYLGYRLYYSRGTGLVNRIRFLSPQKIYELTLCKKVTEILTKINKSKRRGVVFFDIGANIGFISLYIHRYVKSADIYAFEPGPHQRALLETTCAANSLYERLHIFPYAVSDTAGVHSFQINTNTIDAAGDGFIDTNRSSSPSRTIIVETDTIDSFSHRHNVLPDVIKVDIEGAELWMLKGAEQVITKCRPIIFLEINTFNLRDYPYGPIDIITYLQEINYRLEDLDGTQCTLASFSSMLEKDDTFVAYPM